MMRNKNLDSFEIYQVKSGDQFRDYRFENTESLQLFGLKVEYDHYNFVYKDELTKGMGLEDIFIRFNEKRPDDFMGHSLSVSDVVVLNKSGHSSAHFVDSFGFKNIPEFLVELDKAKMKDFSVLKKLKENKREVTKKDSQSKKIGSNDLEDR